MERRERDDAGLVRAAAAGDRQAFAHLYALHALALFRWLAWQVGREGTLASELTAETFAEALRSLHRFRGEAPGDGGPLTTCTVPMQDELLSMPPCYVDAPLG